MESEEIRVLRPDESEVWIEASSTPVRDGDGRIVAALAITRDITERKEAEERTRLLAEVGELLSGPLGREQMVERLVELVVPRLADGCAVDVLEPDGSIRQAAVAHADPVKLAAARTLRQRFPLDPGADRGTARVLRQGQPEFYPDTLDPLLATAGDPEERALLESLEIRSYAAVPLVAGGRVLASLVLVRGGGRPPFDPRDLALAQDLAGRAALALENARLYSQLQGERDRLRRILDSLPEGVVTIGPRLRVEYANEAARRLLGSPLRRRSQLPEPWPDLPLQDFASAVLRLEAPRERRVWLDPDRAFILSGVPARRGEGAVLVITDISERERQERAEREFVTNAAHELRTPVAAIASAIEVLQSGAKDAPERDLFLGHIERESQRLSRLARALLVLARAQARHQDPALALVELRPLLELIRDGLTLAPGVVAEVDCAGDIAVLGDPDLAEQALTSLAGNAARYTTSGTIRLSARAGDGVVSIEVADTGPGVPQEERERIFDRFYRLDDRTGEGFGLGLAIARQAIDAISGTLEIESEPGKGLTARVTLPAGTVEQVRA